MTLDDTAVRRRTVAVQIGLLVALLMMLAGREVADVGVSIWVQLPVVLAGLLLALGVERLSRHHAMTLRG